MVLSIFGFAAAWLVYVTWFYEPGYHDDKAFLCIFGTLFALIPGMALAVAVTRSERAGCHYVKEIGGCNRNACGVRFDDGTIGTMASPVIGQAECWNTLVWRWE